MNSWDKFGVLLRDSYTENQKLFYGALKQMRKTKEVSIMHVKDRDGNILTKENDIMERWQKHFRILLEEENDEYIREREDDEHQSTRNTEFTIE